MSPQHYTQQMHKPYQAVQDSVLRAHSARLPCGPVQHGDRVRERCAAYLIAAEAPTPEAPLAGSIHRSGLHALKPRYGPYVDDQPILQPSATGTSAALWAL